MFLLCKFVCIVDIKKCQFFFNLFQHYFFSFFFFLKLYLLQRLEQTIKLEIHFCLVFLEVRFFVIFTQISAFSTWNVRNIRKFVQTKLTHQVRLSSMPPKIRNLSEKVKRVEVQPKREEVFEANANEFSVQDMIEQLEGQFRGHLLFRT